MIWWIHAFWKAVPMNRGGSHSSSCSTRLTLSRSESESAVHDARHLGSVQRTDLLGDVLGGLGDPLLGHDPDAPWRRHALRKFRM